MVEIAVVQRLITVKACWRRRWIAFASLLGLAPSAAFAVTTGRYETTSLIPPVSPACISSPFGPRTLVNRPLAGIFHSGIDLPAAIGSAVNAVAPGRVIRIQRHGIGGLEVLIQHDGFVGVYSHLGLVAPMLAEGSKGVYGGERIATVGRTGLTYGPHLYFGMIVNGQPIDPAPYLKVVSCGSEAQAMHDPRLRPTRVFSQH